MKFSNDTATLLTETAFSIAMKLLQDTGNQPHEHQRKALFAILDAMTGMAQGSLKGRWAFGLQTGLGKTTCAMSWAAALHKRELAGDVSMVIAAQDVESLCETFDALKGLGVDKDQVGLLHRKPSARYPATPNAVDKPILLLCHARVKEKFLEQFKYRGEMRDLLIYDESLITTSSSTCAAPQPAPFASFARTYSSSPFTTSRNAMAGAPFTKSNEVYWPTSMIRRLKPTSGTPAAETRATTC